MMRHVLSGLCLGILTAVAQNGDKPGEAQREVVPADRIPPAPVLSPADQIRTFRLPPGFTAEVVAAEPLVHSPVAVEFDPQGRLWVVEMIGYMPDQEARGEGNPTGSIAILTDTDGDGRMDTRTVFADGLVMPRAIHLTHGGAVIAEPPRLWWMKDTNGDGKADEKILVASDYATQNDPALGLKSNPEHASNGLLRNIDNWIYSANHTVRFRNTGGSQASGSAPTWIREETVTRGQWGISHDDVGRLFYNSNSDQIRGDLLPAHYLARNPNLKSASGVNAQLAKSQQVWPSRVNPGVNRGYQPNTLTPEGKLASFTAACGPLVYRGDQFPENFRGDVFLCEPSANLIRRNKLTEQDGVITASNAYESDEFLTSTDERFRPVNLQNGPDGALYVVDMARGLIQHRIYLTSYLRKQIESRGLQAPTDLGRIYRIVHSGTPPQRTARLPEKPSTRDLLLRLSSPNGFWRDTAQRLLVETAPADSTEALQQRVVQRESAPPLVRLQALWTLEGQGRVSLETVLAALDDTDSRVQAAAFRITDGLPAGPVREAAVERMIQRAPSVRGEAQIALLCSLGNIGTPAADAAMRFVLMTSPATALRRDAAISGLKGRELAFLAIARRCPVRPRQTGSCAVGDPIGAVYRPIRASGRHRRDLESGRETQRHRMAAAGLARGVRRSGSGGFQGRSGSQDQTTRFALGARGTRHAASIHPTRDHRADPEDRLALFLARQGGQCRHARGRPGAGAAAGGQSQLRARSRAVCDPVRGLPSAPWQRSRRPGAAVGRFRMGAGIGTAAGARGPAWLAGRHHGQGGPVRVEHAGVGRGAGRRPDRRCADVHPPGMGSCRRAGVDRGGQGHPDSGVQAGRFVDAGRVAEDPVMRP